MNIIKLEEETYSEIKPGDIITIKLSYEDEPVDTLVQKHPNNKSLMLSGLCGLKTWGSCDDGFKNSDMIKRVFNVLKHYSKEEYDMKIVRKQEG